MEWQLQTSMRPTPSATPLPLDQFNGANVRLPNLMTAVHPIPPKMMLATTCIRLPVDDRLPKAQMSGVLSEKGHRPPRFILRSTVPHMRQFIGSPGAKPPGRHVRGPHDLCCRPDSPTGSN